MHVFIVGYGDVGGRVARAWLARGARVTAMVRDRDRVAETRAAGVEPVVADLDDIWSLRRLSVSGTLLYYFAPPSSGGDNDLRMRCFTDALRAGDTPQRCVLISTTGVYGDCRGDWIDETKPPRPATSRSRRRLDAERVLQAWGRRKVVPVIVLRVAGIYGPGHWPLRRLQDRQPVLREGDCPYTNRIHVDDLVAVCLAAGERGEAGAVYNVCDGKPSTMTAYFNAVADALHLQRPPVITLEQAKSRLSPGMLDYLSESRRLRNDRMVDELGVELRYPDLDAALRALRPEQGG